MIKNNKIKNLFIYSLIFLFLFFSYLLFQGAYLDNCWNFNNSLQLTNGLLPYRDISIITTPLFHFMAALFIIIFGKNVISFAIFCSFLKVIHIIMIIKIFKMLSNKKDDYTSLLSCVICTFFAFLTYYEYNMLAVLFILFIIYTELKYKDSKKSNIIIGILSGFSFLSKQSIGLFVIILVLLKPLLFKNDSKKNIIYRLIGVSIPSLIFFIYLLATNTFNDFLNYCFFGIKEFKNGISFIKSIEISLKYSFPFFFLLVLVITICVTSIEIYKILKKKSNNKNKIFLFYFFSSIPCLYPIRDFHHLIPVFFTLLPICLLYLPSINNKKNMIIIVLKRGLIIGLILSAFMPLCMYIDLYINKDNKKTILMDSYGAINGIVVDNEYKKSIDMLLDYEKEMNAQNIETIILNKGSVVVHLSNRKYYKDYDLFMRGNFGENGEERLISDIKERENAVFLINIENYYNKEKSYNQLPEKVISYVVNNMEYIDDLYIFRVYKN